jgi:hypothetical protein
MQAYASVQGPQKPVSNELHNACPPKALALPIINEDFGTSRWQFANEITSIPVFLKEPKSSVVGTSRRFAAMQRLASRSKADSNFQADRTFMSTRPDRAGRSCRSSSTKLSSVRRTHDVWLQRAGTRSRSTGLPKMRRWYLAMRGPLLPLTPSRHIACADSRRSGPASPRIRGSRASMPSPHPPWRGIPRSRPIAAW